MSGHSISVRQVRTRHDLTDKQAAFVRYMIAGVEGPMAAELAGYSNPDQALHAIMRSETVVVALEQERRRTYRADLPFIAIGTLRTILQDEKAPAAARVNAVKLALTLAGDLGDTGQEDAQKREQSDMSADDLKLVIARSRAIVEAADAPQFEGYAETINRDASSLLA